MKLGRNLRSVGGLIRRTLPEIIARSVGSPERPAWTIEWAFGRPIQVLPFRLYAVTIRGDGLPAPITYRMQTQTAEPLTGLRFTIAGEPGARRQFELLVADAESGRVVGYFDRVVRFPVEACRLTSAPGAA